MILCEHDKAEDGGARATLDDIFRRAVARHPSAIALIDPPDRLRATDGPPRRLSYAEADSVISAMAVRLRGLGLQTDAVIAMQLPNTIESVVAFLAVLRAGMIVAALPLLWRKADIVAALARVNAKAIVTSSRIGTGRHAELAMQAAAELFSIRHIGVFGEAPDGTVPFDDLFAADAKEERPAAREGDPAAHVAAVTFDVTRDGIVPAARNHSQLIAGGLGPLLEGHIADDATILSATPIASFSGMALTMMPWLLCGGTLALHHPFDLDFFAAQRRALHCDAIVLPAPLVAGIAGAGHLAGDDLKTVLALWRGPERFADAAAWKGKASLVDVTAFGEIGVIAARRDKNGVGRIDTPRGRPDAMSVIEAGRSKAGTLMLRGSMTSPHAFPPGSEQRYSANFNARPDGFIDSGYTCGADADGSLVVTAPPPGIVGVGGYRFVAGTLDALTADCMPDTTLFALPHMLTGQRLVGSAPDRTGANAEFLKRGLNPLIAGAFRPAVAA